MKDLRRIVKDTLSPTFIKKISTYPLHFPANTHFIPKEHQKRLMNTLFNNPFMTLFGPNNQSDHQSQPKNAFMQEIPCIMGD